MTSRRFTRFAETVPFMCCRRKMKTPSKGEEAFAQHCFFYNISPEREFRFIEGRKFRADFAFVKEKILVEIEGGVFTGGRHGTGTGFTKDCEKHNLAALAGYRVLRFTTGMVKSGDAIDTVREILGK